jgi:hypothetical protein
LEKIATRTELKIENGQSLIYSDFFWHRFVVWIFPVY